MDFKKKLQQSQEEERRARSYAEEHRKSKAKYEDREEQLAYLRRMEPYIDRLRPLVNRFELESQLTEIRNRCWGMGTIEIFEVNRDSTKLARKYNRFHYVDFLVGCSLNLSYPKVFDGYFHWDGVDDVWVPAKIGDQSHRLGVYFGVHGEYPEQPYMCFISDIRNNGPFRVEEDDLVLKTKSMLYNDCVRRGALERKLPLYPAVIKEEQERIAHFKRHPNYYDRDTYNERRYNERFKGSETIVNKPLWRKILGI